MKRENNTGISFFQRYLTVWVIICMVLGVLIGISRKCKWMVKSILG